MGNCTGNLVTSTRPIILEFGRIFEVQRVGFICAFVHTGYLQFVDFFLTGGSFSCWGVEGKGLFPIIFKAND